MKIAEFNELFEKITLLIRGIEKDENYREEAIEQLNIMGEELLKAETSMDKFRKRVRNIRAELREVLAQTGAGEPKGNERTKALEKTLSIYRRKWYKLQNELKQLQNEHKSIASQIRYLRAGIMPDSMRPNLEAMAAEPNPRQVKGPKSFGFYKEQLEKQEQMRNKKTLGL
jgi:chromosome segregation ATPase